MPVGSIVAGAPTIELFREAELRLELLEASNDGQAEDPGLLKPLVSSVLKSRHTVGCAFRLICAPGVEISTT